MMCLIWHITPTPTPTRGESNLTVGIFVSDSLQSTEHSVQSTVSTNFIRYVTSHTLYQNSLSLEVEVVH